MRHRETGAYKSPTLGRAKSHKANVDSKSNGRALVKHVAGAPVTLASDK